MSPIIKGGQAAAGHEIIAMDTAKLPGYTRELREISGLLHEASNRTREITEQTYEDATASLESVSYYHGNASIELALICKSLTGHLDKLGSLCSIGADYIELCRNEIERVDTP